MPYSVKCSVCHKAFKTGRSLSNHLASRHPLARPGTVSFSDENGRIFEGPKPHDIPEEKRGDYLKWLSVLAERVNGSLLPDSPGKWSCTDCFLVPNEYFCHILHRLKSPPLFSVWNVRHCRQPMFKKDTKRLSYKIYDEQLFREVMEEQRFVPLKFSALYRNDNEVADLAEMDVEDALAMARARAKKNIPDGGKPTSKSTIEIEHGEGRCTREVEFIWWPSLYSQTSGHGKLSVWYYLKKVSL